MDNRTPPDNVIHLYSQLVGEGEENEFLALAERLIKANATSVEGDQVNQSIVGDSNLQFSSNAAPCQTINGNFNIQIATTEVGIEQRLASLEALLKNATRS